MSEVKQETYCMALGGTNARIAKCSYEHIRGFESTSTPDTPDALFRWIGKRMLDAEDAGISNVVIGLPGLVHDGFADPVVGPMQNIPGLSQRAYKLKEELDIYTPGCTDLLRNPEFKLAVVNDGDLAAFAVAGHIAQAEHKSAGALIIGTGVGFGMTRRRADGVFEALALPMEIGAMPHWSNPAETFEDTISGAAIIERFGNPRDLDAGHPVWKEVGRSIGHLVVTAGALLGVDLVVPTGGIGMGASDKYGVHLSDYIAEIYDSEQEETRRELLPSIAYVEPEEAQIFEMFGAPYVIRSMAA